MSVLMQARSSVDGRVYSWRAASVDYAGAGFPGPGLPLDPAVCTRGIRPRPFQALSLIGVASAEAIGLPTVVRAPALPLAPSDVIAWFDGDQQAYSDLAGTTQQNTPGGTLGRVNETSPLTANWQGASSAQRALKDAYGVRSYFYGSSYPGMQLVRGAATVNMQDVTIVASYLERDGLGGPTMGLLGTTSAPFWGMYGGAGGLGGYVNQSPLASGLTPPRGQKCSVVMRMTPTALKTSLLTGGVTTSSTVAVTVTAGSAGAGGFALFHAGGGAQGYYGSVAQLVIIGRAVSDSEATSLLAWADSKAMPEAYPIGQPLIGIVGDSIARAGVGVQSNQGWWSLMLQSLRGGVAPGAEACNVAIVGSGVGSGGSAPYSALLPFLSSSRKKQVTVVAIGTNDLANGNNTATTIANIYAVCDALRAAGSKVVLQNILPRQGLFNLPGTQASFNAAQATANADFAVNWASHADAFVDVASLTGLNDPTNTTYYQSDKVHPTAAGMSAMATPITAAVAGLL
jgi:lysophospholipase L1-like esterase